MSSSSVSFATVVPVDSDSDSSISDFPHYLSSLLSFSLSNNVLDYSLDVSILPSEWMKYATRLTPVHSLTSSYLPHDVPLVLRVYCDVNFPSWEGPAVSGPFSFSEHSLAIYNELLHVISKHPCEAATRTFVASCFSVYVLCCPFDVDKVDQTYEAANLFFSSYLSGSFSVSELLGLSLLFRYFYVAHLFSSLPFSYSYYKFLCFRMVSSRDLSLFTLGRYSLFGEYSSACKFLGPTAPPRVPSVAELFSRFGSPVVLSVALANLQRWFWALFVFFFMVLIAGSISVFVVLSNLSSSPVYYESFGRVSPVSKTSLHCDVYYNDTCAAYHFSRLDSIPPSSLELPSELLSNSSWSNLHKHLVKHQVVENSTSVETSFFTVTKTLTLPVTLSTTVTSLLTTTENLPSLVGDDANGKPSFTTPGAGAFSTVFTVTSTRVLSGMVTTTVTAVSSVLDSVAMPSLTPLEISLISIICVLVLVLVSYTCVKCFCGGSKSVRYYDRDHRD